MSSNHKILIIDDDEGIRTVLQTLLEMEGYEVIPVGDAQMAIDLFLIEHLQVNLILLELSMPKLHGLKFAELLRSQGNDAQKKIPIVITSATDQPPEILDSSPFNAFLGKPFQIEQILITCKRYAV